MGKIRNLRNLAGAGFLLILLLFPLKGEAGSTHEYGALFTEEILTVNRERDGILPGTLRTALIQASGIRDQNSFTLVTIVFAPEVRRVRVTKGPLPSIDGSLTTLDCLRPQGKVVIEYVPNQDNAGENPGEEPSVLLLNSNGNLIRGCHITGAVGPGILIEGNRNVIEHSIIGFHPEVPESTIPPSALYDPPKTNGRAGIALGRGSNENIIQHNDIIGNTYHGVLLDKGIGTGNKILYNFFAKNSGLPIKAPPGSHAAVTPTIQKITQNGDTFFIEGISSPNAEIQIYMLGESPDQVEMLVAEGKVHRKNTSATFTLTTKSKGFALGVTKLVALSHGVNLNTSEFSQPIIVGSLQKETPRSPEGGAEVLAEEDEEEDGEQETNREAGERDQENPDDEESLKNENETRRPVAHELNPEDRSDETEENPRNHGSNTGRNIGSGDAETIININGQGEGGGEPDSGENNRQNAVTSLGM